MGNEELWEDCARKMISLADESAAPGTSANALNLAGIIAGSDWQMAYSGGTVDAVETVERPAVAGADFAKALKYFEAGEKLGDQTCASNAENARKIIAKLAEKANAPKAGTLADKLSSLTEMNRSKELADAIAAADAGRTPENAYKLAHEIYQVVYDQSWFVLGNEGVWANAVKTMQQLAEEGANGGVADAMLLAGVIAGKTWQIGGTVSGPGEGGKWESEDVTQPPVIVRDDEKALAWFEKGAALGHEYCTKNAEIARRVIAEKAAKENPPPSSTPPAPPPPA
jgi:TPR repeat protein